MAERIWSTYSNNILDVYNTKQNMIVKACPGAGKTTNIERLWSSNDEECAYLVFARANKEEAEGKLPKKTGSQLFTINGLGMKAITSQHRVELRDDKVKKIVWDNFKFRFVRSDKMRREIQWWLIKAASMAKQYFVDHKPDISIYEDMVSTYNLDEYDDMYYDLVKVVRISDGQRDVIDFADQVRLPALYHEYTLPPFHSVLGDEVQDWSPIQALLVSRIKCDHITLVGDQHQSIYGFRGAMCDSMELLKDKFNCVEMPLSISYRCSKVAVERASQVYPGSIKMWEHALDGTESYTSINDVDKLNLDGDTLVVCRCTRPLIEMAYTLLEQGKPCYVRGRAIGDNLVKLITKLNASSVGDLYTKLNEWAEVECNKARLKDDDKKLQNVQDKVDSLHIFMSKCTQQAPVQDVVEQIDTMFAQGRGVQLSTVHKAKGLEADKVVVLQPELFDIFKGRSRQAWQLEQEGNIEFVAYTRSRNELVHVLGVYEKDTRLV